MTELWLAAAVAVAGLFAGRLANSLIERLPQMEPWSRPLLSCHVCHRRGRWIDALPLVGWISRGGRCRLCRAPHSVQALVVEAVNGVLWMLLLGSLGPTARALATMVFVTGLLVLSLIDLEHHLLPDSLTLPGIVLGVIATRLPGWPVTFLDSALTAAVGYFAMMALAKAAEWYYREEALGQGDWKMVAMLGAFLGSTKTMAVVLAANVSGAFVGLLLVALLGREGRQKLPLGTFLGASGIAAVFF